VGLIDRKIEAFAASQYSVFATWQLGRRGIDSRALIARNHDGRLRRLYRGVYATSPYLSLHGRWMAATLACGPTAMLSHHAAAAALDLVKWSGGPTDVTVPRGARRRNALRIHESRGLQPHDRILVDDRIPVTSVARTLLDLAATTTPTQLQRAYERAQAQQLLDINAATELLARCNGHRGIGPLTALLGYDPTAQPPPCPSSSISSSSCCEPTTSRCRAPTSWSTASWSIATGRTPV
jgi:predicted transcriptional regulator of viral defense system